MEKRHFKIHQDLRIFDQILNQEPKIVNLNQKSDFVFLYPRKV